MTKGRKILLGFVLAVVIIIVALVIIVPPLVDVDRYRPQVVAYLQEETGKPAKIGHLALTLFPSVSIRVDDFALGNPRGFPQGDFVGVRRVYALVDAGALWNRQVVIKSLELDDASINLVSNGRGHWNFETPPKPAAMKNASAGEKPPFTLGVISKVSLKGGHLTVADLVSANKAGPAYFEAQGVSSQLQQVDLNAFTAAASGMPSRLPEPALASAVPTICDYSPWATRSRRGDGRTSQLMAPISWNGTRGQSFWPSFGASLLYGADQSSPAAQGTLTVDAVRFQQLVATSVKSKLRLFPKQLYADDLNFTLCGGRVTGNLSLNFAGANLRYATSARLMGVDMAKLLEAFPDLKGKMTGKMEGSAKISGEVVSTPGPLAGVRGTGQVTVRDGLLPSLQLNKNLMLLGRLSNLGPASGDPSSFSSLAADFDIANQKISSKKVALVGNGVNVDGAGTMGVVGAGSLDYQGVASLAAGENALTGLLAGFSGAKVEGGKLTFPFALAGTLENPKFNLKSAGGAGGLGALPGALLGGQAQGTQAGQPQQPADLVQGITGLFKKKKQPAQPPKP